MHIAHFIQRYPPALGGSEAYFQRLGQYLVEQGDQVTVWSTTAADVSAFWSPFGECLPAGETDDHGVIVRRFPLWQMVGRRWLLKPLSMIPLRTWQALTLPCNPISLAMWRAVKTNEVKYDAVHATAFPYAWPIVCAERLARRQGIPFLLTPFLHLGDPEDPRNETRRQYTQPALRRLLLSADRVFLQTEMEREAALDLGVKPERAILQGLGVEVVECTGGDRQRARETWGVQNNDIVIGHLANLSAEKGAVDLVLAHSQIHQGRDVTDQDSAQQIPPLPLPSREGDNSDPPPSKGGARGGIGNAAHSAARNIHLVLAGPAMPNYMAFRNGIKRPLRISELGVLTDDQKRDFFAGIDLFVLPSRSDSFGLVLLEAWANRKPVIAYKAGGPAELIRPGVDGHLVRCGDIDELADRIVELGFDEQQRRRLGEAGRQRLDREFQWADKLRLVHAATQDAIDESKQTKSTDQKTKQKTQGRSALRR